MCDGTRRPAPPPAGARRSPGVSPRALRLGDLLQAAPRRATRSTHCRSACSPPALAAAGAAATLEAVTAPELEHFALTPWLTASFTSSGTSSSTRSWRSHGPCRAAGQKEDRGCGRALQLEPASRCGFGRPAGRVNDPTHDADADSASTSQGHGASPYRSGKTNPNVRGPRNALRHGLTLPVFIDPAVAQEVGSERPILDPHHCRAVRVLHLCPNLCHRRER